MESDDVDLNDDSTYLIEVLNDEGDAVQDENDEKLFESNNDNESDCDTEDAVSFLKNVTREDVDTTKTFKQKAVRKNHSCNYCKKRKERKI